MAKNVNRDYRLSKLEHLRRAGLIAGGSSGLGQNGGVSPDWLAELQDQRRKRIAATRRPRRTT